MARITLGDSIYDMSDAEWHQVKSWVTTNNQELAIHWWESAFGISRHYSVSIINCIQLILQYGDFDKQEALVVLDESGGSND